MKNIFQEGVFESPETDNSSPNDKDATHDGSAGCCVGMWNRGVWAVERFVV